MITVHPTLTWVGLDRKEKVWYRIFGDKRPDDSLGKHYK